MDDLTEKFILYVENDFQFYRFIQKGNKLSEKSILQAWKSLYPHGYFEITNKNLKLINMKKVLNRLKAGQD